MEKAKLGIDGNCGFALLGLNIQEGESEFVEIEPKWSPNETIGEMWKRLGMAYDYNAQVVGCIKEGTCFEALRRLKVRLNKPDLEYYFI